MAGEEFDDSDLPEPSLKNILEQESLQWVFVGGEWVAGQVSYFNKELKRAKLALPCPRGYLVFLNCCSNHLHRLKFFYHHGRKRWCRKDHHVLLPGCATGDDSQKGMC